MNQRLVYDAPAATWYEGLPIGTGRLIAMVLGGIKCESLALNHEWLWIVGAELIVGPCH